MLGLIQMRCDCTKEESLRRALLLIAKAAKQGAQIVCLPELFLSPYFCQRKDSKSAKNLAEPIPGPATKALSISAKEHGIVLIGGSLFESTEDGCFYNTAVVFDADGSLMGIYRKTHIPEDPRFHEQHYFSPGNTGIGVFKTRFGSVAVLICYDQWFPEAARIAALKGADVIFYPTAIGRFTDEEEEEGNWQNAWENVQRGHAIANSVFVAAVNRVGTEGKLDFWGGSFVCNDFGTVIAHAGLEEEILLAECDFSRRKKTQEGWGFFRNRRPSEYDLLTRDV
jgi:predicted amidohydrolase